MGGIRPSVAVALVRVEDVPCFCECGATTHASNFYGFSRIGTSPGNPVFVVTMRGSEVTPIMEGGLPMVPGEPLYLSETPGELTHTPPSVGMVIRVGNAFSDTKMTINTDTRVGILV